MTNPLTPATYPSDPTMPTTAPLGYVTPTEPSPIKGDPPLSSAQIQVKRQEFYELILRQVVLALSGIFIPGGGPAFDQLEKWVSDLLNGNLGLLTLNSNAQTLPYPMPFLMQPPPPAAQLFVQNLIRWAGNPDFTAANFDPVAAAISFAQNVLVPGNIIAPVSLVQSILDKFVQIVNQSAAVNNPFSVWVAAIQTFFGMTQNAQATAISAASSASQAVASNNAAGVTGGLSIFDPFDGPYTVNIGTNYTTTTTGAGAGYPVTDGAGFADWFAQGGLARAVYARHGTSLFTNNGEITTVFDRTVQSPSNGDESYNYILARVSGDLSKYVFARIGYNSVAIGFNQGVTNETLLVDTLFNATSPITAAPGDSWTFRFGTVTGAARRFILLQNGRTIRDVTDTGNNSINDSTVKGWGLAMSAGRRDFGSGQTLPANLTSIAASDKTPA